MVYYEQQTPPEDEPGGCLEVLVITRAVFGILLWPVVVMFVVVLDLIITFWLFTTYAPLALIPIAITAAAIALFARWEQRRFRPPDL